MRLFCTVVLSVSLAAAQSAPAAQDAEALFSKGDWAGAAKAFRAITERDARDGRAWFRLGASLFRLKQYGGSADAFRHAVDLGFQPLQAMAAVARAYAGGKQPAQAIEWLDKAAKAGFGGTAFIDSDPGLSGLKDRPEFPAIYSAIRRNGKPCLTSPEYAQFDFWLGQWDVEVSGQKVARSRIEKIADGCLVQENWMPFNGNEGKSWNLYNASTGHWEQLWMSAGNVLKLSGNIENGSMVYTGTAALPNGGKREDRLTFTPENGKVRQLWRQSTDGGKTWTTAFDGMYNRAPEQPITAAERRELLEHLRNSQKVFADSLRGVSTAQAHFKAAPDRWSILECAEHLAQAEQLLFADAIDGLKMPPTGRSSVTTDQILQVWGTRTQKAQSSGDYDPKGRWPDLATTQKVFDERRAKTMEFVSTTEADLHGRICCGNLDIWQQILAVSAHTLRHVQQIEEVKASAGYPKS